HMSTPAGPGLAGAGHAHASGNYIVTDIFPGSGPWIIITHEVDVLTGQGRGVTVVNDVPMPIAPAVKGHFSTADILGFSAPVGALAREDYESRVVRHTRAIFRALEPLGVPRIHFGTNTPGLLEAIADSGPDIVSLDWRLPLDEGWCLVGHRLGVQGISTRLC